MNHKTLTLSVLSIAAFAVGCDKEQTTSQQLEKVRTETKQAARDMKDYTFAQKSEFTEKMKSQLAEIHKDLDQLAVKIEKSSDAAKAEARPKLKALREKADQLGQQLDEVKNATESTWETVKRDTRHAYDGLKDGFQQSRQWLSEKIAP